MTTCEKAAFEVDEESASKRVLERPGMYTSEEADATGFIYVAPSWKVYDFPGTRLAGINR